MNLNGLKQLFSVMLLTVSVSVSAQKTGSDVEVITFGSEDKKATTQSFGENWIVKTNPMSFITGNQTVFVERRLSDYFTIEGGVGVTFKSTLNLEGKFLDEFGEKNREKLFNNWGDGEQDIYESNTSGFKSTPTLGRKFSLSPRFYFGEEAPEGQFLGAAFTHSTNNFSIPMVNEIAINGTNNSTPTPSATSFKESIARNSFTLRYGGQWLFDRFTFEYFWGGGIAYQKETRLDLGIDKNGIWRNKTQAYKYATPMIEIGVRIGLLF